MSRIESITLGLAGTGGGVGRVVLGGGSLFGEPLAAAGGALGGPLGGPLAPAGGALGGPLGGPLAPAGGALGGPLGGPLAPAGGALGGPLAPTEVALVGPHKARLSGTRLCFYYCGVYLSVS